MDEAANIERLRLEIEALHRVVIDKVLEVATACIRAERELTEEGLEVLGSKLSFGPSQFSRFRRIGADARLRSERVLPLLPTHSVSSLYEISGWSDDKLEAAIAEKVLTPKATRSQLEAFGRAPRSKAKRPGDFLVMIPPPRKEVFDDFMHDADELCEKYGVSLFCPAWDEYLRLWDEREKKVRTYLRKKVRAMVQDAKRKKKASGGEWGFFAEETELHGWYDREHIRRVAENLVRVDAFARFVTEAEALYSEPDLILPEPCVSDPAPSAEPRRYFKRARYPNSVVFHATGEDTALRPTVTTSKTRDEKDLPASPSASQSPQMTAEAAPIDEGWTAETGDEEVNRIIAEAARELEQEEAERSSRSRRRPQP